MTSLKIFNGRKVAVLGLGAGGRAVVENLEASGAHPFVWDAQPDRRDGVSVSCVPPKDWPMAEMAALVLADGGRGGLSRAVVERAEAEGVPVFTELDLFAHALEKSGKRDEVKVIAVTGAAGKSVTVSIIAHVLREQGWQVSIGGGDLGVPLMDLEAPSHNRVYLLELPIRRLVGLRKLALDISVTLNLPEARQKDEMALALRALMKVHKAQRPKDTAIIGVDDLIGQELCTTLRTRAPEVSKVGNVIPVSGEAALGHGVFVLDGAAYAIRRHKTEALGDFSRSPGFLGAHFNQDAAAAIAVCLDLGLAPAMIIKSLHSYEGLPGRFECLGAAGKVVFVDDSYASNTAAAERAIHACPNVFWIGGNPDTHEALTQGGTADSGLNGAYLLYQGGEKGQDALRRAFEDAYRDAAAYSTIDPDSAPVVLFAPGVSPASGGFSPDDFRDLVSEHMTEEERAHA